MKRLLFTTLMAASVLTVSPVMAGQGHHNGLGHKTHFDVPHHDSGKRVRKAAVINIKPVREKVEHVEWRERGRCNVHRHHQPHVAHKSSTDEIIIGGLLGGLIGNQVVDDRHQTGGAVVGALLGAIIGNAVADNHVALQTHDRGKCRHIVSKWKHTGDYRVTYRFNGEKRVARLSYNPGDHLHVDRHGNPARS